MERQETLAIRHRRRTHSTHSTLLLVPKIRGILEQGILGQEYPHWTPSSYNSEVCNNNQTAAGCPRHLVQVLLYSGLKIQEQKLTPRQTGKLGQITQQTQLSLE